MLLTIGNFKYFYFNFEYLFQTLFNLVYIYLLLHIVKEKQLKSKKPTIHQNLSTYFLIYEKKSNEIIENSIIVQINNKQIIQFFQWVYFVCSIGKLDSFIHVKKK